jgi:Skp family chaperone for outer membrane proteins
MTLARRLAAFGILWLGGASLLQPANPRAATLALQSPDDSYQQAQLASQDEREQEKRDREQELRERDQDRKDHMQELYDDGRAALDEDRYQQAEDKFSSLVAMNGPQTDAALYWKAYAQNRQGKKDGALASISEFKRRFTKSRWLKDVEALQIEVQQSAGQKPNPETVPDNELKALALRGVINNDPDRGIAIAEKILAGTGSPKEKAKVLFLIAQTGSPKSTEVLGRIARGQSNPELQRKAVEYLGMFGGEKSRQTLSEVYASAADESVKRAVLRGYMMSGDKQSLFAAAKSEKDENLKRDAIRNLGLVGGQSELQELYKTEPSTDIRREILQGLFLAGDSEKLLQAAESEKDPELRRTAIRNLGLVGGDKAASALQSIYAKETDRALKEEVLNAYFLSGNAKALVAIAKTEKDPGLKKRAVEKLSLMGSKEGNDYLLELLDK